MQTRSVGSASSSAVLDSVIRQRTTQKLLLPVEHRAAREALWTEAHRQSLQAIIEAAGWAPFHKRCDEPTHRSEPLTSPVPWRFHILEGRHCTNLLDFLKQQSEAGNDEKWLRAWQSKIKEMVSACGALVQITWLPDPTVNEQFELSRNNIEHIAASAAAIQNLLLGAEALGWYSYWSSGGILRDDDVFEFLGISTKESLLGSVFLSPDLPDGARVIPGGLRDQRGTTQSWARWIGDN